jgi:hypothetical protein
LNYKSRTLSDVPLLAVRIERSLRLYKHHKLQVQQRALHTDDWSDGTYLPVLSTSEDRNLVDTDIGESKQHQLYILTCQFKSVRAEFVQQTQNTAQGLAVQNQLIAHQNVKKQSCVNLVQLSYQAKTSTAQSAARKLKIGTD